MFYLGIDQHARQLTISLRDDQGDVVQARQVSTQPEKIQEFFKRSKRDFLRDGESFLAVVEVCGINDWLLTALGQHQCHKVILIQPEERKRQKTDRRDEAALSELLWVNRDRFLAGKPVPGLRQVQWPSATDQQNRRLSPLRKEASAARTRVINKIKLLLRRHHLPWSLPTKTFPTQRAVAWLKELVLPEIDRLEMTFLVAHLEQAQQRVDDLEKVILERSQHNDDEKLLRSIPGVSDFTTTSLVCHVGNVHRFRGPAAWPTTGVERRGVASAVSTANGSDRSPKPAVTRPGGC